MTSIYDAVPYPSPPRSATHPARYAVNPVLLGYAAPPPERARVLEVGCGEGGNLIAMAVTMPEAEFVGLDLSETQIAAGRKLVAALGLSNVRLETADILTARPEGLFDYVVAHGVLAWVPLAVRDGLMRLIAGCLSPEGLAFVSYNVLPGSHIRQLLRDSYTAFLPPDADDAAKLAGVLEAVAAVRGEWAGGDSLLAAACNELDSLSSRRPEEMFHDEMAEHYAALTVSDAAAIAERHGLAYLCDSNGSLLQPLSFPSESHQRLMARANGDWVRFEHLDDVACLRRFRQSVFGHAGRRPDPDRRASALADLHAEGTFETLVDEAGVSYRRALTGALFQSDDPVVVQIMDTLTAAFPSSVPVDQLLGWEDADNKLLRLYTGLAVGLRLTPNLGVSEPGERPLASPLARLQIALGMEQVASLRHTPVLFPDPGVRAFLGWLDGRRDRAELARLLGEQIGASPDAALARVDQGLKDLAERGLLLA